MVIFPAMHEQDLWSVALVPIGDAQSLDGYFRLLKAGIGILPAGNGCGALRLKEKPRADGPEVIGKKPRQPLNQPDAKQVT